MAVAGVLSLLDELAQPRTPSCAGGFEAAFDGVIDGLAAEGR